MTYVNVDEMTFDEIVTSARKHATEISAMLYRADPNIAASVLLQLAEIEEELVGALYSDFLSTAKECENTPELLMPL